VTRISLMYLRSTGTAAAGDLLDLETIRVTAAAEPYLARGASVRDPARGAVARDEEPLPV
jgi:hypothetical protein